LLLIFATAIATNPGKRVSRPALTNKSIRYKIVAMRGNESRKAKLHEFPRATLMRK